MSRNKKIIIAVILIAIFGLCFIPPKANNSKYKLEIKSSYGDTQAFHPKVLNFENKWNGYKYWMSYTPYPKGDDSKENPHIAVSNDLINWTTPQGLTNPLDERVNDGIKEQYNSDSHLVYNSDKEELECYWRYVDDLNKNLIIYRRTTKDGIHWTEKEITAHYTDRNVKDYISPAIIYENHIYKMWYVNQDRVVNYAISNDGINWNDIQKIQIKYDKKLSTWHLDVIKTEKGYEMIIVAYDKWENRNDMNLYYTKSKDGLNWEPAKTIIQPTKTTSNWDNKGIYRSSFIYENGKYFVYYSGTKKNYEHGIGFVYGKDIFNLNSVDTNFKNQKEVEKLIKRINND